MAIVSYGTDDGRPLRLNAIPKYIMVIANTGRLLETKNCNTCFVIFIYRYIKMPSINNSRALITTVAALLVVFGVVAKNSLEQMKIPDHAFGRPMGMAFFVSGWLLCAHVLSVDRSNRVPLIAASLAILGSVLAMKSGVIQNKMVLPLIFAVSWIVLGYNVSEHLPGNARYLGLVASACVIVSMMSLLPAQRANCIVDGPGMPLFVTAWGIIVYANSVGRS